MPKLDDAAYQEGRQAFASGASLRSIVEHMDEEPSDEVFLSSALGFADAFLDLIRAASQPREFTLSRVDLDDASAIFKQA